jgi:SP family arabinose:H+ symporter-like MFS transporter
LADKFGRRITLIACAIFFAVSGIGAGLAHQLYAFILFRLIGGLGVGAAAMVSPMYIAEMAPAKWRGRLVAFYQMAIVIGILADSVHFTLCVYYRHCDSFTETSPV